MKIDNSPLTSHLLINSIGLENARKALFGPAKNGKIPGKKAIEQARWKGVLPARWYAVLKEECTKRGLDCPKELFSFISPRPDHDE